MTPIEDRQVSDSMELHYDYGILDTLVFKTVSEIPGHNFTDKRSRGVMPFGRKPHGNVTIG